MPVSRFAFYFLTLATFSTIAFASEFAGYSMTKATTADAEEAANFSSPSPQFLKMLHHHSQMKRARELHFH